MTFYSWQGYGWCYVWLPLISYSEGSDTHSQQAHLSKPCCNNAAIAVARCLPSLSSHALSSFLHTFILTRCCRGHGKGTCRAHKWGQTQNPVSLSSSPTQTRSLLCVGVQNGSDSPSSGLETVRCVCHNYSLSYKTTVLFSRSIGCRVVRNNSIMNLCFLMASLLAAF